MQAVRVFDIETLFHERQLMDHKWNATNAFFVCRFQAGNMVVLNIFLLLTSLCTTVASMRRRVETKSAVLKDNRCLMIPEIEFGSSLKNWGANSCSHHICTAASSPPS